VLNTYKLSQILDITSVPDINILKRLSNPTNYACTAAAFSTDSWIPSTNQKNNDIPCKVQSAQSATSQTCKTVTDFESGNSGCTGCIDTTSILNQFSSYDEVMSSLNNRYSDATCAVFNQ
jgi:hypothetical protein